MEEISSDFGLENFHNNYSLTKEKTDSLFDVFDSDELRDLIAIALKQNSDIFIYNNRINIAESQSKLALSNQMPSVNGSLSYSYDGNSRLNASLMASWELDIFGKYASAKNASEENLAAARENLVYFKISLISDISLAYFNIKYLQNNIILTKERIKNYRNLVEVMDISYRNGLVDFAQFLETKADLQQEEQTLNTLLNTYEEQKNAIRVLINDKNYQFSDTLYEFQIPKFFVNLDSSADLILNRPDIKSQIYTLNVAVWNLNSTKAQMYPSISVSGNIAQALLSPLDFTYSILSSLTLPIFSRMEIYENIKIQDYTRLIEYYTLQKSVSTALAEIENAIYSLESNKKTLEVSIQMLKENEEIVEVLKQSNELGLIDSIEYLNAINSNLAMIKNNNTSYFNTISATIYLYRSIGGNIADTQIAESSRKDDKKIDTESIAESRKNINPNILATKE